MCLPLRTIEPDPKAAAVYEQLYPLYRDVYFALGRRDADTRGAGPRAAGAAEDCRSRTQAGLMRKQVRGARR